VRKYLFIGVGLELIGWMIDIAREQSPKEEVLDEWISRSEAAGYNTIGFYLEHRFRYESAPWAAARGALSPETVRRLIEKHSRIRCIPFLNTLGHMEGFIRSEGGQWLAEGTPENSSQICPSRTECVDFVKSLIEDTAKCFRDEWIHLGGDETWQLGECPLCKERAEKIGKARIYAQHYKELCETVLEMGKKRPCMWGDMLLAHPEAMHFIPKETVIFDWQYGGSPNSSTELFRKEGFDVVCCPALHTFDAGWCYWDVSKKNIDEHRDAARSLGALGVCVTTWEFLYFSSYFSVMPLIFAIGRHLAHGEDWDEALSYEGGEIYAEVAQTLGVEIPFRSKFLGGGWRNLRRNFVENSDIFALWREWREEACSEIGDRILASINRVKQKLFETDSMRFPLALHEVAIEWVRKIESARILYEKRDLAGFVLEFAEAAEVLSSLSSYLAEIAKQGGSLGDLMRLRRMISQQVDVLEKVRMLGEVDSHSYLPAFELLIHPRFVPGGQAGWDCR